LRITLPTNDKIVAIAALDEYLIIGCEKTIWAAHFGGTLPSDTGQTGSLPQPTQLPFPNGCTGQMLGIRSGVAYSSTAGGIWVITRNLTNEWLSQPLQKDIVDVTGLAVDVKQRLFVATGTNDLFVYDMISSIWSDYVLSDSVSLVCNYKGFATIQDSGFVSSQTTGYTDIRNDIKSGIGMDATLADISFAKVKNWCRVWAIQLLGKYKGPHNITITVTEPDEADGTFVTTFNWTPSATKPYNYEINLKNEQASTFGIRIVVDFKGVSNPSQSCILEMLGASVGLEPNISRLPYTSRIPGR
jgi:hypothetical protein